MKIRPRTLWRVPVYCMIASFISFFLTAYLGGFFFGVQTVRPDGAIELSIDPLRSAVFNGTLFLCVLVVGGFLFRRSMTMAEIAASAAIITLIYLAVVLMQICWPDFPLSASIILAYFQNWTSEISSMLYRLTNNVNLSALLACFSPMLFIPFGKRA